MRRILLLVLMVGVVTAAAILQQSWPNWLVKSGELAFGRDGEASLPAKSNPVHAKDKQELGPVAVQRGPQGLFAWIVRHASTVEAHPIDAAATQDDVTIVNSGISAGDQVVVNGQYRLEPGSHVNFSPASC